MANPWIEAMRLRTLPVSVAGVLAGAACAIWHHGFRTVPMLICLLFAILAQIASNFANEYYDFRNGLDRKGREGFRRGVTEGDITPAAMKRATFATLGLAAATGCSLIAYGGWWLLAVGAVIVVFALAYSAGPWPLSHHGLGDEAVVVFFGFVPVVFTQYVMSGTFRLFESPTFPVALATGLLAANVLIVNNYRDLEDDRAVGKRTKAVIFGRRTLAGIYLGAGITALVCYAIATTRSPQPVGWLWTFFALALVALWKKLTVLRGSSLNGLLKWSSIFLLAASASLLTVLSLWPQGSYTGI